ncbi:phage tail protein [Herbaspirillum huttiense]|uniref:Phage tail protein n=2 Tax=Herbaspirillum huttiense TaxID=863372 RepID=A0AAJ2H1P0_9BURK|nr:phage tail protein [Herbaspirillum huttiense]MDR9834892.1 phage tail protein [Herbaspirillum huttiense]
MDYPLSRATELGLYNGKFTSGIPGLRAASIDDADFMNVLVDSLLAVQTASGQTHAENDTTQLVKAIFRLIQRQVTLDDTGTTANSYSAVNDIPLVNATLLRGLEQRLVVGHTNSGPSTYSPDGLPAKPIYGMGMLPLQGGEMLAGGIATLAYSPTANSNTGAWILLRCTGGAQQGAAALQGNQFLTLTQAQALATPVGMYGFFPFGSAPDGWLKANGSAIPVATYSALASRIYCGDANNASALYGYRCTNQTTPSSTRSTTGAYIVLPDVRGEFLRGWDDGRGVDASRLLWLWQAGQVLLHNHAASSSSDGYHAHNYVTGGAVSPGSGYALGSGNTDKINAGSAATDTQGLHNHTISIGATGGSENLVRNLAALTCIKY